MTSDREVIAAARARGAQVVRSEAFVRRLEAPGAAETAPKKEMHLSPEELEEWLEIFGMNGEG